MATNRIMTIGNQQVNVVETELKQSELLFYPENPRVYNALHGIVGENPSQDEIQRHMQSLDSVKLLKLSIEANGGLLEPIIVRKNIVLEGNSRLAAYRLLAKIDPIKWGKIKANVMPDETPEEFDDCHRAGCIHSTDMLSSSLRPASDIPPRKAYALRSENPPPGGSIVCRSPVEGRSRSIPEC